MTANRFSQAIKLNVGFWLGIILFWGMYLMPTSEGMSPTAQKVASVTLLMISWWVSEAIPIAVTALVPLAAFPVFGIMNSKQAAALMAAAAKPELIKAVVSRGGRPDLAVAALAKVRAPTLLIVGGSDTAVIRLNQDACREIRAPKDIHIVPNATHLFEEPGALEEVAAAAAQWFARHFADPRK